MEEEEEAEAEEKGGGKYWRKACGWKPTQLAR